MSSNRKKPKGFGRQENTREERKGTAEKTLLTFSFKDLDESQPANDPQSIASWAKDNLLSSLFKRIKDISKLSRDEAVNQKQIKIYGDFPPKDKTNFYHPQHVDKNISWSVIKAVGGQKGVVAGYVIENTFYLVFLDKSHKFWISVKKHT